MSNNVENHEMEVDRVQHIPISDLKPFDGHPFKVVDDEAMLRTTESIAQFGVLTPLLVRPLDDGSLQIISGHRRVHAAEAAGLSEVPVIVRNMTDDEAVVLMVDSNMQRENILPSERAFAYKMKLEAMKRQGERTTDVYVMNSIKDDVLRIASGSYYQGPNDYELFVFNGDDELVKRDVRLGESSFEYVEVLSGLKEGDRVVTSSMNAYRGKNSLKVK